MTLFLRIIIQLSVSFLSYSVFNEHTALLAQVCQSLPMQSLFFHHPSIMCLCTGRCYLCVHCTLVGPSGLEPPTSCLSGTRSNLLSYDPMWLVWRFVHTRLCFRFGEGFASFPSSVSALSYFPGQLPVKYLRHCRA